LAWLGLTWLRFAWLFLDGLLSETGRSIDGKNAVLMETFLQIFFIFEPENAIFDEF